jgi:ABC-type Fe3+ transport system substrate-binding protein
MKLSSEGSAMVASRSIVVGSGLITLAATLGCGASRAQSIDELYQQAKSEKTLVLYAAGPTEPHERFVKEFQQRFPGLTVALTGGFSNALNEAINHQIKDKKVAVDMAFFQTVQDFVGWKKQGVLLDFKPEGIDAIPPNFRDPDGAYTAVHVNPISYAYNTKRLRPEDAPKSALDFLKEQFNSKLITVYPADDDATLYLFHTIVEKYGWGYMDKYMANKPTFVQGHLGVARSVATGENAATFDATSSAWRLKRDGQPIEVLFSQEDETPVFTVSAGIFKDAPHPSVAKLYLAWYLAKEQQSRTGTFSPRSDVGPPAGLKPLSAYRLANRYREFVSDETRLAELRKRFEAYTGPVVNKGGVK